MIRPTANRMAAGAAGLVVAGVLISQLGGGNPTGSPSTELSPSPATSQGCPDATQVSDDTVAGSLPPGALSVRLCPKPGAQGEGAGVVFPADELTSDVDTLMATYNDLPAAPAEVNCPGDAGMSYLMVFRYDGGRQVSLPGYAATCGQVGDRLGGEPLLGEFTSHLQAQRTTAPAPRRTVADPCSLSGSVMPADRGNLAAASLCIDGSGVPLPPAAVAALQADLVAGTSAGHPTGAMLSLNAADVHGDVLQLIWGGNAVTTEQGGWVRLSDRTLELLRVAQG